mgnify:CR=1 FL=1
MKYSDKLKSPKWQKKRLETFKRDDFKCCNCNDAETELHVHHLKYTKEPYDSPLEDLQTLCKHCHYYVTFFLKQDCLTYKEDIKSFKIFKNDKSFIVAFKFTILIYIIQNDVIEIYGVFNRNSEVIDIMYNLKYNL